MPAFTLKTKRLVIQPFTNAYLEDYYQDFTDEITQYQYPDSFSDIESAHQLVSAFVADMERGEMLELVILTQDGAFLGSLEVFGLREQTPEIGLWLKKSAHAQGYGYEADVRNTPSIRLAQKFQHQKGGYEEITTDSGKKLMLQTYRIYG